MNALSSQPRGRASTKWNVRSIACMWCGKGESNCECARFPGFKVARWEGEARNYAFESRELLRAAAREALKDEAPLDFLVATLRYYIETGG